MIFNKFIAEINPREINIIAVKMYFNNAFHPKKYVPLSFQRGRIIFSNLITKIYLPPLQFNCNWLLRHSRQPSSSKETLFSYIITKDSPRKLSEFLGFCRSTFPETWKPLPDLREFSSREQSSELVQGINPALQLVRIIPALEILCTWGGWQTALHCSSVSTNRGVEITDLSEKVFEEIELFDS